MVHLLLLAILECFWVKRVRLMSEMLGNQYFINGLYEKAIQAYEEVLEADPQNSYVLVHCILAELKLGILEKALLHYIQLLALRPIENIMENAYLKPVCREVQTEKSLFAEESQRRLAQAILDSLCNRGKNVVKTFKSLLKKFSYSAEIEELIKQVEELPDHV